ncbi:MAG TPA: efflux transporter outer membrane subunit [Aliidongia sp.]|uniref:efflux transporter outer membrane subunit n=1 Tax=Aliidongia sp. TaxID=1914230 RepID=UPI002DDCB53B|nr:efflux transporter outer membrane subunit [Aliidongia sp.]HEV2676038.1 efflux transporter outer membrane subunit [Aliidongia sp.]
MKLLRSALLGSVSLLAAACAVGPDYKAPEPAPVVVQHADPVSFIQSDADADWWHAFEDAELDGLVKRALAGNLDLRASVDRVRQARALFDDRRLDQFPRVTSSGGYNRSYEQVPGFGTKRANVQSADLGFDAGWEIDLFGHVQRSVEAADADAGTTEAEARDAQVTVAAEVARNYFELRGAQNRRVVAEHNAQTQRETLKLTQTRVEVGRGDPTDIESAKARLAGIEATIPAFTADETRATQRLAVLVGERPGTLDAELAPLATPAKPLVKALPIGDASGFLRRRPDVQAAERRLAAETARVGVATADLFPRVTVTGFIGLLSGDVSQLFTHGAGAYSVAPAVTWPALDLGGAHARLRAQEAKSDESLANYDQTVLRAIEDLETALDSYHQQQAQIGKLSDQVAASRRAAELARIRYQEGTTDFLVLLDAQRTQLQAEDALTAAETSANTDIVAIYKALGGSWA